MKKFFNKIQPWDIYFVVVTAIYLLWRARVFLKRMISP